MSRLWTISKGTVKLDSLPIEDESEGIGMLEIEDRRARIREVEFGRDWTVCIGQ